MYPYFMHLFEENPITQGLQISSRNTKVLGTAHSEISVILACTIFIDLRDGQTEQWTPSERQAIAKTREAFCCRA